MPYFDEQADYDQLREFAEARLSKHQAVSTFGVQNRFNLFPYDSDDAFSRLIRVDPIDLSMADFVFIDGLHTYEQCKKDLDNYLIADQF